MKLITKNKRAYFDYEFDKFFSFWIVLKWHEVKSIKSSQVNIKDSIIRLDNSELFIKNMDIPLYSKTSIALVPWYESKQSRKLLVTKNELSKISWLLDKPWNELLPLEVFITKSWFIKIKWWIGKRKRKIEKKQIIKERDIKRQMDRDIKKFI